MKKIIFMIIFTIFLLICLVNVGNMTKNTATSVQVITIAPTTEKQYVTCTGKISEENASEIYASNTGHVEKLLVAQGEEVKKGQLIMQIRKDNLPQASSTPSISASDGYNIPSDFDFSNAMEVYGAMQQQNALQEAEQAQTGEDEQSDELLNIYAPTAGVVRELNAAEDVGVETNTPVCIIAKDLENLTIDLSISENMIADVQVGQMVEISGAGFKNSTYTGVVTSISLVARQAINGTSIDTVVDVKVRMDNAGEDVKPGFTSTVKIITSEKGNTIIVPYESVRAENDGTEYVLIVEDGVVRKRYIKTGIEFENGFEIISGLKYGDLVVQSPDSIEENERVEAKR